MSINRWLGKKMHQLQTLNVSFHSHSSYLVWPFPEALWILCLISLFFNFPTSIFSFQNFHICSFCYQTEAHLFVFQLPNFYICIFLSIIFVLVGFYLNIYIYIYTHIFSTICEISGESLGKLM